MKQKYYACTVRLIRESDQAVQMDIAHANYGVIPGAWVPKSVIDEDSLEQIEDAADGDDLEIYIAAWWLRRNYSDNPNGR